MAEQRGGLIYPITIEDNFSVALKRLQEGSTAVAVAMENLRKSSASSGAALDRSLSSSLKSVNLLTKKVGAGNTAIIGQTQLLTSAAQKLEAAQNKLASAQKRLASSFANPSQLNRYSTGLNTATQQTRNFQRATQAATQSNSEFGKSITRIVTAFVAYRALFAGLFLFRDAIGDTVEFSKQIEQAEIGVTSLITELFDLRDAQGNLISGAQGYAAATGIARDRVERLRREAQRTVATFDELLFAFQSALGPGSTAGFNLDEIERFSILISQAAAALTLPQNQLAEEIRSLLQGTITPRATRIATALGLDNELIRRWKELGTLQEELFSRLDGFAAASGDLSQTLTALAARAKSAFLVVANQALGPFIDEIKNLNRDLGDAFEGIIDSDTASQFRAVGEAFAAVVRGAKEFVTSISQEDLAQIFFGISEALKLTVSVFGNFLQGVKEGLALFSSLFGVVNNVLNRIQEGLAILPVFESLVGFLLTISVLSALTLKSWKTLGAIITFIGTSQVGKILTGMLSIAGATKATAVAATGASAQLTRMAGASVALNTSLRSTLATMITMQNVGRVLRTTLVATGAGLAILAASTIIESFFTPVSDGADEAERFAEKIAEASLTLNSSQSGAKQLRESLVGIREETEKVVEQLAVQLGLQGLIGKAREDERKNLERILSIKKELALTENDLESAATSVSAAQLKQAEAAQEIANQLGLTTTQARELADSAIEASQNLQELIRARDAAVERARQADGVERTDLLTEAETLQRAIERGTDTIGAFGVLAGRSQEQVDAAKAALEAYTRATAEAAAGTAEVRDAEDALAERREALARADLAQRQLTARAEADTFRERQANLERETRFVRELNEAREDGASDQEIALIEQRQKIEEITAEYAEQRRAIEQVIDSLKEAQQEAGGLSFGNFAQSILSANSISTLRSQIELLKQAEEAAKQSARLDTEEKITEEADRQARAATRLIKRSRELTAEANARAAAARAETEILRNQEASLARQIQFARLGLRGETIQVFEDVEASEARIRAQIADISTRLRDENIELKLEIDAAQANGELEVVEQLTEELNARLDQGQAEVRELVQQISNLRSEKFADLATNVARAVQELERANQELQGSILTSGLGAAAESIIDTNPLRAQILQTTAALVDQRNQLNLLGIDGQLAIANINQEISTLQSLGPLTEEQQVQLDLLGQQLDLTKQRYADLGQIAQNNIAAIEARLAKLNAIASDPIGEGLRDGFDSLNQEGLTAYNNFLETAVNATQAFSQTVGQLVVQAFQGNADAAAAFGALLSQIAADAISRGVSQGLGLLYDALFQTADVVQDTTAAAALEAAALSWAPIPAGLITAAGQLDAAALALGGAGAGLGAGGAAAGGAARGGAVQGFARGGPAFPRPSGIDRRDTIPAWLRPGEHVIRPESVRKYGGHRLFDALNRGLVPASEVRHLMSYQRGPVQRVKKVHGFATGGPVGSRSRFSGSRSSDDRGILVTDERFASSLVAGGESALARAERRRSKQFSEA